MSNSWKKVVITGMGVVSPLGCTLDDYWSGLANGKSGVGYITKFDTEDFATKIAAEVKGFNLEDFLRLVIKVLPLLIP